MALGTALLRSGGDLREANKVLLAAIRHEPEDATSHGLLAMIHAQRGAWHKAMGRAELGLEIDPDNETCAEARALALSGLEQDERAAEALENHLSINPDAASTHDMLGHSRLRVGDFTGAVAAFRESIRLDPAGYAQERGLRDGLRARYWFYRPLLRLTGRLREAPRSSASGLVGLLLCGFLLRTTYYVCAGNLEPGNGLARTAMAVAPFVLLFTFSTPLANALLLLRHDRADLPFDRSERADTALLTSAFVLACAAIVYGLEVDLLWAAIGWSVAVACLPLLSLVSAPGPRARRIAWPCSLVTAAACAGLVSLTDVIPSATPAAHGVLQAGGFDTILWILGWSALALCASLGTFWLVRRAHDRASQPA